MSCPNVRIRVLTLFNEYSIAPADGTIARGYPAGCGRSDNPEGEFPDAGGQPAQCGTGWCPGPATVGRSGSMDWSISERNVLA